MMFTFVCLHVLKVTNIIHERGMYNSYIEYNDLFGVLFSISGLVLCVKHWKLEWVDNAGWGEGFKIMAYAADDSSGRQLWDAAHPGRSMEPQSPLC